MQAKFAELSATICAAQGACTKLLNGTRCESARCRNGLSQASKMIAELRKMALDHSKSIPKKTKAVKDKKPDDVQDELPPPPELVRQSGITVADALIEHDLCKSLELVNNVKPLDIEKKSNRVSRRARAT